MLFLSKWIKWSSQQVYVSYCDICFQRVWLHVFFGPNSKCKYCPQNSFWVTIKCVCLEIFAISSGNVNLQRHGSDLRNSSLCMWEKVIVELSVHSGSGSWSGVWKNSYFLFVSFFFKIVYKYVCAAVNIFLNKLTPPALSNRVGGIISLDGIRLGIAFSLIWFHSGSQSSWRNFSLLYKPLKNCPRGIVNIKREVN